MPEEPQKYVPTTIFQQKIAEISPAYFQFQSALQKAFEPMVRIHELIDRMRVPALTAIQGLSPYVDMFRKLGQQIAKAKMLYDSGWLPHYTIPLEYLDEPTDDLKERIGIFYQENWVSVRKTIENRIAKFTLDDETKEVFAEALDGHERKMYRSVGRLIFPEIERISRQTFPDPQAPYKGISSQLELRKAAGSMAGGGYEGLMHYEKLEDHLYKNINNDQDLDEVQKDAVPNRHATIHGYVVYNTPQNSLNALFMFEYILLLFEMHKRNIMYVPDDLDPASAVS